MSWLLPMADDADVAGARAAAGEFDRLRATMAAPESAVTRLVDAVGFPRPAPETALPTSLQTVDRTVDLLSPAVRAVGVGGGAAALVLIGAWAGQRVRRRDDELRSLVARGLSPARGAGQAVAESLLPLLVGLAAGGAVGWLLIAELGPSPTLGPDALPRSLLALAAGAVAALAVLAAVTAGLLARLDQVGRGPAAQLARPGARGWRSPPRSRWSPPCRWRPSGGRGEFGVLTLVVPLLATVVVGRRGHRAAALDRPARRRPAAPPAAGRLPGGAPGARRGGRGPARRRDDGALARPRRVRRRARRLDRAHHRGEGRRRHRQRRRRARRRTARRRTGHRPRAPWSSAPNGTRRSFPATGGPTCWSCTRTRSPAWSAGTTAWPTGRLEDLMRALTAYDGDRVPVVLAGGVPDDVLGGRRRRADHRLRLLHRCRWTVVAEVDAFPGQGSRDALLVADWDRYVAALEPPPAAIPTSC